MRPFSFMFLISLAFRGLCQQDVQVDPATGRAQVSIPLWTVSVKSFTMPIALVYNDTGVKVKDTESNAGMNWMLLAGGEISRELRGLPDDVDRGADTRKGWLSNSYTNSFTISPDNQTNWNTLVTYGYTKDLEPDIFTISAPGLSGKFVFDNDRQLRLIPYQDVNVEVKKNANNEISGFIVKNNIGYTYTFGVPETVERQAVQNNGTQVNHFRTAFLHYQEKIRFHLNWKLTQIVTPTGDFIEFEYSDPTTENVKTTSRKVQTATYSLSTSTMGNLVHLYSITDNLSLRTLSKIKYGTFVINFSWQRDNIKAVEITHGYQSAKVIEFEYASIHQADRPISPQHQRDFLRRIIERSVCNAFPSYEFEYHEIDFSTGTTVIPFHDEYKQDYWGYYNGSLADNQIPRVYVNESASHGERFSIFLNGRTGYTEVRGGADRSPDPVTAIYGALKRIIYPAGGYAQLNHELADYGDNGRTAPGGGIRISSITLSDGDSDTSNDITRSYEYRLANGVSSGRFVYNPSFAFADGANYVVSADNLASEGDLLYARVIERESGKGFSVYEYAVPGTYPQVSIPGFDFEATNHIVATAASTPRGNLKGGYYSYPFAPNLNYDFERPLLTRLAEYAEGANLPLRERQLTYARLNTTATYIKAVKFEQFVSGNFLFSQYRIISNVEKVVTEDKTFTYNPASLSQSLAIAQKFTFSSTHHMLRETETTNSEGLVYKKFYKYAKDFSSITDVDLLAPDTSLVRQNECLARLNSASTYRHGTLIEETDAIQRPDNSLQYVSSSLVLFSTFGKSSGAWPSQILVYNGAAGFLPASVQSVGTKQTLSYSNKYRLSSHIQSLDEYGNILTTKGLDGLVTSTHFGFNKSLPVVSIVHASAKEVCYTDFETTTGYNLEYPIQSTNEMEAWSGKRSLRFTPSMTLTKDGIRNTAGALGKYIVTLRVKASTSSNITLNAQFFNGSAWISSPLIYRSSDSGHWKYLRTRVSMSGIPARFNFRLSTTAAVFIDDIAIFPEKAEFHAFTYEPLFGKTSTVDARGEGEYFSYDQLGRLQYTFDSKKNLSRFNEYKYRRFTGVPLRSDFKISGGLQAGEASIFTAPENCGVVNYQWKIDDRVVGANNKELEYIFQSSGWHSVELTVTTPNGDRSPSTFKTRVNISPPVLNVAISSSGPFEMDVCNATAVSFTVTVGRDCEASVKNFTWYYKTAIDQTPKVATWASNGPNFTFSFEAAGISVYQRGNFSVWCEVTSNCSQETRRGTSAPIFIKFDNTNKQCQ